jgi:hypothetical protein
MLHYDHEFGLELRYYKSSGGGGSSGKVEYPGYIETVHKDWLNNTGADTISSSVTDIMNAALGNSPYAAAVAYDPDTDLAAMDAIVSDFEDLVDLLSNGTPLNTLINEIVSEDRIDDQVAQFTASLDDKLLTQAYPAFEAGMRDINAVQSSAFVLGRSIIEDSRLREITKFESSVRFKVHGDDALQVIALKLQYQGAVAQTLAESKRIKIVVKNEETNLGMDIDDKDARWDLETFQYGANMMASPAGGTAMPGTPKVGMGKTQSTVSGAMAGAAIGTQVDPGYGTAIGAVVGGVAGYLAA